MVVDGKNYLASADTNNELFIFSIGDTLTVAYFDEFSEGENVSLIIKTSPINPSLQNEIINNVVSLKEKFSYNRRTHS